MKMHVSWKPVDAVIPKKDLFNIKKSLSFGEISFSR